MGGSGASAELLSPPGCCLPLKSCVLCHGSQSPEQIRGRQTRERKALQKETLPLSDRNVGCFPHADRVSESRCGIRALSVCDTSVNSSPVLLRHFHCAEVHLQRKVISCSLLYPGVCTVFSCCFVEACSDLDPSHKALLPLKGSFLSP